MKSSSSDLGGAQQIAADDSELAKLGYKRKMGRSLGSFSTFAIGFAFISILTGVFQLFGFAYNNGGPAMWWVWVIAVFGQLLFALSFGELAVKFPLAGSVYNWTKQIAKPLTSWVAGISLTLALTVSTAAVALAWQFVLPSIWSGFQFVGDGTGKYDVPQNAVILGGIMIICTTLISLAGTKVVSLVNNIGVTVELVAVVLMIVFFALHAERGVNVVMETNGTGANHNSGYLGAMLISILLGLYVMWGFDTAGSVGEETINPRKTNPRAIVRALLASGVLGGLLILTALMAVKDLNAKDLGSLGLTYVVTSVLGDSFGKLLLICVAIAIFVCALANQTGAVRMIYAMSRDNALPFSRSFSKVSNRGQAPVVPILLVAVIAIAVLISNINQPQIFLAVTSTTVILALISYVLVVGPLTLSRLRGKWAPNEKGHFSLGKFGLAINLVAFIWGVVMIVNIAWPRQGIYNPFEPFHWYLQWGGVLFPAVALAIGAIFYATRQHKHVGVRAEHRPGS
jgi:urea carboxylase system permease